MSTIKIPEFTITTPTGVTTAEAVRLFSDHHNYQETVSNPDYDPEVEGSEPTIDNPDSRAVFAKKTIARQIQEAIKTQRLQEAKEAVNVDDDITVE